MEMASANVSQGMADQITLSASDGSESESESNHANSSVNSSSHVEVENGNTGGKKPTSWNESRIKLPFNYFQFMYDKKDGKGFSVKCLICHKTKTKFNKKDEIELLTITDNSGYNAKRHIRVSCFLSFNSNTYLCVLHLKGPALDEKWKFKHTTVICKHSGKPTSRSKDHTRQNQFQFACECPFNFKIVFNSLDKTFVIPKTGFNINHENHEISAEHIQLYHRIRILYVTSKDIENHRQLVLGLSTSEWGATSEKLELLRAGGSIIHVDTDDDGEVNLNYIQLQEQVELFAKYPEAIQLDGTHRTNNQLVFFFVREETTERIKAGLQFFSNDNNVQKTEVIITDKDCAEIGAAKEIFVHAKHMLCHFHAFRAVDIRLRKANLELNHRKENYDSFHRAVYAKSQEELEIEEDYLVALEDDELAYLIITGSTLRKCGQCYHKTIKDYFSHRQRRLPTLIECLVNIVRFRIICNGKKSQQAGIKFSVHNLSPLLEYLQKSLTPCAWEVVLAQTQAKTANYTYVKATNNEQHQHVITSTLGTFIISLDLSNCSFSAFLNHRLPCRHILYIVTRVTAAEELPHHPQDPEDINMLPKGPEKFPAPTTQPKQTSKTTVLTVKEPSHHANRGSRDGDNQVEEEELSQKNRRRKGETSMEQPPAKKKKTSQEAEESYKEHQQQLDAEEPKDVPESPNNSRPADPDSPKAGPSTDTTEKPATRLPERKRGPGCQAKSKALDFFKWSAKPFQKKKNVDQAR
ncbi:Uncharacterized protein APZ42_031304, partial [Daphnia magna]